MKTSNSILNRVSIKQSYTTELNDCDLRSIILSSSLERAAFFCVPEWRLNLVIRGDIYHSIL